MNILSDFYKDLPKGRCHPCEFAKYVGTWEGWGFLGCYHPPYTGKRVSEIKKCPKCETKMEGDEECSDAIQFLNRATVNEYEEFLDMAIEALEQEPIVRCKDCRHT